MKRDSTTLSAFEKSEIRSAYLARFRGDHEEAVALTATKFNVSDATVRLLVLAGTQTEIGRTYR